MGLGQFLRAPRRRASDGADAVASDDQTIGVGGPDGAVAVISEAYWEQRFGGDPAVVGRSIASPIRGRIVGVMPTDGMSLEPGRPIDIAVPMMLSDPPCCAIAATGGWTSSPGCGPGSPEQARAESDALFQAYMADLPMSPAIRRLSFDHVELTPAARGLDGLRRQFAAPLGC